MDVGSNPNDIKEFIFEKIDREICKDNEYRVGMTTSCRDCMSIAKVLGAGSVFEDALGRKIQIMHNGLQVVADCYYGPWMTEIIQRLQGHHEPQEEVVFDQLMKLLGSSATMIELGGYWSYYSLWFLHAVNPGRRAVVLEPDPIHIQAGIENSRLNHRHSFINFIQGSIGSASKELSNFQSEKSGKINLRQYCLADLMTETQIDILDLLHCDVQGAETDVLVSCENLIRNRRIKFILLSTHSHHISGDPLTHQKCLKLMHDFGGRILAEHDVQESYSGDGMIAAYFGEEEIIWPEIPLSRNRTCNSLFRNPLFDLAAKTEI